MYIIDIMQSTHSLVGLELSSQMVHWTPTLSYMYENRNQCTLHVHVYAEVYNVTRGAHQQEAFFHSTTPWCALFLWKNFAM
jgi:hypothetical protein